MCTEEPCSFLTIDITLLASDPLRFRKNLTGNTYNLVAGNDGYDVNKVGKNEID